MEILLLCGIYFVEILCYHLGLKVLFGTKVKKSKCLAVGIVVPILLGISAIYDSGKLVLITVFVILLNLLLVKGKLSEKIFENAMILVLTCCLEDVFIRLWEMTLLDYIVIANKYEKYFLLRCFIVVIIIMIYFIPARTRERKTVHVNAFAYFVIGLVAVSMMICQAVLNYIKKLLIDSTFIVVVCGALDIIIHINVFMLVIFIMNIQKTNVKIEELLQTEKRLKTMQMDYYCRLLDKEEETRKYRHDMNNHFYYIQMLLENGQITDAKDYFMKLQKNFQNIQSRNYVTGNDMIDVIMNYYFSLLPKETTVQIIGRCPVKLIVEDVDICTIFSNVFQNVMEAMTERTSECGEVEVIVRKGKAYVEYVIANTCEGRGIEKLDKENALPITSKANVKNHGIGLMNVKKAVERNNGKFSWEINEGRFYVKIILPI